MTNASFLPAEALPPAGSAVREKSRFRRYSFSCDAAVEAAPAGDFADLADFAAFFELFGFATRLGLLGMGSLGVRTGGVWPLSSSVVTARCARPPNGPLA